MSYTSKIKDELLRRKMRHECCRRSMTAALLLFSRLLEGKHTYMTANQALAQHIADSAASFFGLMMCIRTPKRAESARARYTVCIPELDDGTAAALRKELLDMQGYLECEECAGSFIRGAFLISGFSYNPEESLRAEISACDADCAEVLSRVLRSQQVSCSVNLRRGAPVIIIKKKETLEQFFAVLGSSKAAMDVMNASINREVKSYATRTANCDNANIERTLSVSFEQIKIIRAYVAAHSLESLPIELRELARLRIENPDMSLRELGESLPEPISRSGVNHRLRRLIEYCKDNLKKENTNA